MLHIVAILLFGLMFLTFYNIANFILPGTFVFLDFPAIDGFPLKANMVVLFLLIGIAIPFLADLKRKQHF